MTCSDASTCTQCKRGFSKTSSNQCRGCSYSCSSCNPNNITECTSCAPGLALKNGKCEPCSDTKCKVCDNSTCTSCVDGYTVGSNNTCIPKCKLPCLTCQEGSPSVCLSCQTGSTLSNGTCVIDLACNTAKNCVGCGLGLNYYLLLQSSEGTC